MEAYYFGTDTRNICSASVNVAANKVEMDKRNSLRLTLGCEYTDARKTLTEILHGGLESLPEYKAKMDRIKADKIEQYEALGKELEGII